MGFRARVSMRMVPAEHVQSLIGGGGGIWDLGLREFRDQEPQPTSLMTVT